MHNSNQSWKPRKMHKMHQQFLFAVVSAQISTNITHMTNKRGKFEVCCNFHFAQLSPSKAEDIHLIRRAQRLATMVNLTQVEITTQVRNRRTEFPWQNSNLPPTYTQLHFFKSKKRRGRNTHTYTHLLILPLH